MQKFETVPFDPGYSNISFSFIGNIQSTVEDYQKLKTPHQKKFWLVKIEPAIIDLINKSTAFYLGCMLWGGFISCRFKKEPKEITGNHTKKLNEEEIKELDCAIEVKEMLGYIEKFNRDFKYFLKRPSKIPISVIEILNSYIEFAKINNNFVNINYTNEVKLPEKFKHFEQLSDEELDVICEKIYETIRSGKIELLLGLFA